MRNVPLPFGGVLPWRWCQACLVVPSSGLAPGARLHPAASPWLSALNVRLKPTPPRPFLLLQEAVAAIQGSIDQELRASGFKQRYQDDLDRCAGAAGRARLAVPLQYPRGHVCLSAPAGAGVDGERR